MSDFLIADTAAQIATKLLVDNAGKLLTYCSTLLGSADAKLRSRLPSVYAKYIVEVYQEYEKAKSFLIRDEPTNLYDFYIPLGVSSGKQTHRQASILNVVKNNPFVVITASGGGGKSILMRHLFLDTIKQKVRVPVFVELRNLNDGERTLFDIIKHALTTHKFTDNEDLIKEAIKQGHFAFFLDGFDELAEARVKPVVKEIRLLTEQSKQNYIIISSRFDPEFVLRSIFSFWDVNALTLKQAIDLIKKLPEHYPQAMRNKFIVDLKNRLFKEYNFLASNPLLLSMMFLVYLEHAAIPKKLSEFYKQAYDVLFRRHDVITKDGFPREMLSGLDGEDFAKVFAAFSLFSCDERAFSFSETQALDFLSKAKANTGIEFATANTCAMQRKMSV